MHRGDNGQLSREVPIPMVALVATAVSHASFIFTTLNQSISCMPLFTSGVLVNIKWWNSLQTRTWMCTYVM